MDGSAEGRAERKQQKQNWLGLMMLSDRMFAPTAVYGGCNHILTLPFPHHPSLIRMAHNTARLNSFKAELTGKNIPVQFGQKQNEQKRMVAAANPGHMQASVCVCRKSESMT